MKRKASLYMFLLIIILCLILWSLASGPGEDHISENHTSGTICAVLAHPDDETIVGSTLAKLIARGFDITVIYVTSGDDGPDKTGRGLHGDALAEVREKETLQALHALGIKNPPVFLRFPDSHVPEHVEAVRRALHEQFNEMKPQVIIGFGPDGITGDQDHRMTGFATDLAFDLTDSGRLLLHMAITKPLSPMYPRGVDVSKHGINVRVNVSRYASQRTRALEAHLTQFNRKVRSVYKTLVHTMRTEKFIIARNRDAGEWLERCFDINDEKDRYKDGTDDGQNTISTH